MINALKEMKADFQSLQVNAGEFPGIELIEMELINALSATKGTIREMCSHVLNAGGKRIRPLLVLYSGQIFTDVKDELIQAAVASELIHMASLVHDDIIDNSVLRRNRPSVNHKWGNQYAVLCGDNLFARAFGVLAGMRSTDSLDYMVEAIENMCSGEINQANDKFNCSVTIKDYYKRIEQKTAAFLKCCCMSGAAAGRADEKWVEILGEFGLNLGYAFQIIDDILDFCGNVEKMGKPGFEDLKDGNITLPVLMLLQDKIYGERLRNIIETRQFSDNILMEINKILLDRGIMDKSFHTAALHVEKAKSCLNLLPQNQYTGYLYAMADLLKCRVN